jgi:hypothetical protein
MTTVVYILLHLDSVFNELFSRLFIFLLLLPVINDKFSNFRIHFSQNNVSSLIPTAVALSASRHSAITVTMNQTRILLLLCVVQRKIE